MISTIMDASESGGTGQVGTGAMRGREQNNELDGKVGLIKKLWTRRLRRLWA